MTAPSDTKGICLGLTGGIGCGKTTVGALLEARGWSFVETDSLVRKLLSSNNDVIKALKARWGGEILDDTGSIDRSAVAGRVFSDAKELSWLESLLHPLVRAQWLKLQSDSPDSNWVIEVPLLYEKSLEKHFDLIVCVYSSMDLIANRMAERGFSREAVESRSRQQLNLIDKVRRSHYVIDNTGSLEFLKLQLDNLSIKLKL